MSEVRLSVLLPLFKPNESWLREALESLKKQTYQEWILVISLDGHDRETTQGGCIAVDAIGAGKTILVSGGRSGITGALNRGLRHCKTEYIARMDADDVCLPNRFFEQIQVMDRERELVACGTQIIRVSNHGKVITSGHSRYPETHWSTLLVGATFNTPIAHPTVMMRSRALNAVGGYRDMQCMEDYDIFSRLARHGDVKNIPYKGLLYRVHERQHSQSIRPTRSNLLRARLRFARELIGIRKISFLLIVIPLALWGIGPQGEMMIRRYCRKALNVMKRVRDNL